MSLGAANTVKLGDKDIKFTEVTIRNIQKFDARNLKYCKYLNLRNSSFNSVEAQFLPNLLLIDISFTQI